MEAVDVILEPILTEKSSRLREGESKQYLFKVNKRANKIGVIEAVRELYQVNPVRCNIINVKGKKRSNTAISKKSFKRGYGRTSSWKKAVVILKSGETIAAFDGA